MGNGIAWCPPEGNQGKTVWTKIKIEQVMLMQVDGAMKKEKEKLEVKKRTENMEEVEEKLKMELVFLPVKNFLGSRTFAARPTKVVLQLINVTIMQFLDAAIHRSNPCF